MWPFKKREQRSKNFTSMAMESRANWITAGGIGDLTSTVQGSVSLWENGLSMARGTSAQLTPQVLALTARSLALTGESVWIIDNDLVPVDSFDLTTQRGRPVAYRVTVPDAGGGRSETLLAGEVLHFRIGANPATPWRGTSPLRRASLSAGMLNEIESALSGVYSNAPLGSQIVPMPENTVADQSKMEASFRGKHGRVLLPESTNVSAAGGPAPNSDWKPADLTPNMRDSMAVESWRDARGNILHCYGILPCLLNTSATGPVVREAQRHLAQWTLAPIASMITHEVGSKMLTRPELDVASPLHAFDAGGRARALSTLVQALASAKDAGIAPDDLATVAEFVGVPMQE